MNDQESTPSFNIKWFVLMLFVLLAVCFSLWWSVSAALVAPLVELSDSVLKELLPYSFHSLKQQGADVLVYSQFGELNGALVPARDAGHYIAFQFNTQILSYSLPFFIALTLATPGAFSFGRLFGGVAVLYPLIFVGLLVLAVKTLMVGVGEELFREGKESWLLNINLVALMYQLSTLLIPSLVPVLIWGGQNRALLAGFLGFEQEEQREKSHP